MSAAGVTPGSAGGGASVGSTLAEWTPVDARGLDPLVLAKIEPFARAAVAAAGPSSVSNVRRLLRASFGISAWMLAEVGSLGVETVWHPENVRIFVEKVNGHRSVDWRQDVHRTLKQIASVVNPQFWTAEIQPLPRSGPAVPYEPSQEAALRRVAFSKSEPGRPDEAAVAGFSLGAALNATQIANARPSDMIDLGEGRIGIRVTGTHSRLVPIRADYTELVLRAVDFVDRDRFVTATSRNAVYTVAQRVLVHGFGHLYIKRARSTWLLAHLKAGTPIPALRAIAGPLSMNTLDALCSFAVDGLTVETAAIAGLRA